MVVFTQTDR